MVLKFQSASKPDDTMKSISYRNYNNYKNMDMKKTSIIKAIMLTGMFVLLNGCTKSFDELNTNPNQATVVPATNVLGRGILSVAGTLFGERLDI